MKKSVCIVVAIIAFVAIGVCANAQDQSKRALVEELLTLMNVKDTQERILEMVKQMIVSQIKKVLPPKDAAEQARVVSQTEKLIGLVKDEMGWDKRKEDFISIYAATYTEPELKDIIAFYKTSSGQSFIKKQPEVLKRSFELSQKIMTGMMPKIQAMANEFSKDVKPQSAPAPKPQGK